MTNGHQVLWNLHQSYREWLKCWRRKNFDVFRRSKRINLTVENMKIETTCGQLNFMTWLFKYDVIDYCTKNKLTVRGTQALVSFAPLAFKLFCAARQNAVLRRSPFPPV